MDILRKMFKMGEEEARKDDDASSKNEFRKPPWFDDAETDDELFDDDRKFAFQIFTNPMELQKHFERQMQQILEAVSEYEQDDIKVEKNVKEEYLKPGFENSIFKEFEKQNKHIMDTDLDGEIYADELHSLMQRFTSNNGELPNILPSNDNQAKRKLQLKKKLTDEEIILGKIHGTLIDDDDDAARSAGTAAPSRRSDIITPMLPMLPRGGATPFGGVFEGTYQGPKMFSQSVMTKTIRKPDGSYETTKVTQDSKGNKTTTVIRTVNGKTETVTSYSDDVTGRGAGGGAAIMDKPNAERYHNNNNNNNNYKNRNAGIQEYSDRNIYITKDGYAVPRNL